MGIWQGKGIKKYSMLLLLLPGTQSLSCSLELHLGNKTGIPSAKGPEANTSFLLHLTLLSFLRGGGVGRGVCASRPPNGLPGQHLNFFFCFYRYQINLSVASGLWPFLAGSFLQLQTSQRTIPGSHAKPNLLFST